MSNSSFTHTSIDFSTAEQLEASGSTCNCYRMKLFGKQHFVKRLKPEYAGDPRYKSMLQKEFETGYSLEHPNLVNYLQIGEDFIITDYVDGERLSDFITSHADYFKEKSNRDKIINQLLSVTEYLHSHQVLHLDLKPDNIIITRIGHDLKLVDLGFSYTDTFPDTPGYTRSFAAPEQMNNTGVVDERTDIFALCKIMALIPFGNELKPIVERCTQVEPEKRYQTVGDIRKALNKRSRIRWFFISSCLLCAAALAILMIPKHSELSDNNNSSTDSLLVSRDLNSNTIDSIALANTDSAETAVEQEPSVKNKSVENYQTSVSPEHVTPNGVVATTPGNKFQEHVNDNPAVSKQNNAPTKDEGYEIGSQKLEVNIQLVNKLIKEFKDGIRPHVIKMIDYHTSNGGIYKDYEGQPHFLNDMVYIRLRNEYTDKYYKPIKIKLLNKYGNQLTEIDKYELPNKFEIAISEVENNYIKQIGLR